MATVINPLLTGFDIRQRESSNINWFGIHFGDRKLFVQFHNGSSFMYDLSKLSAPHEEDKWPCKEDDEELWGMLNDEVNSLGRAFNALVKYRFTFQKYDHELITTTVDLPGQADTYL